MVDFLYFINDPVFRWVFIGTNLIAFACWLASVITQNFSHVDRLWSLLPMFSTWLFLATSFFINSPSVLEHNGTSYVRLTIMTLLATAWGIRLTYNFWRKDGYNMKSEDYRWVFVRKMFNYPEKKILFNIFNFVFIAFMQIWLLVGLAIPMWFIQSNVNDKQKRYQEPLNYLDILPTCLFLFFLLIETVADQQQWNFQTAKYEWINNKKSTKFTAKQIENFKRGFLIEGLFKYSRHPNFWAEVCLWWSFYLFSITSQFQYFKTDFKFWYLFNYSISAVVFLTLLFQGSTYLTERITQSKYPEYAKYKAKVSRLMPFFTTYKPKNEPSPIEDEEEN